ncbi:MAG TPA: GWxTD domain-containing protein [Candidatus Angelobacter sp.]
MTLSRCRTYLFLFVSLFLLAFAVVPASSRDLSQQKRESTPSQPIQNPAPEATRSSEVEDPLKRPLKERKATQAKEGKYFREWEKEVQVIITNEELAAFRKLSTDLEREKFIEGFWLRRDPTPDTEENEYKDEFYRRKAYANERFSAGVPGEQTDRGRIYILYGKPDSIEPHPMGGPYLRPAEEGGGATETYPFEIWRYRHLDDIGQEITIEFVDQCGCGDYRKTLNHSDKDALRNVPNAGLTDTEAMLGVNKGRRLQDPEGIGQSLFNQNNGGRFFERMDQDARLDRPPALRIDRTDVSHVLRLNPLRFDVRVDFLKGTADTVLTPITIQVPNRELTFVNQDGVQRGLVNIFGRLTTVTGATAQTFEDTLRLDVPSGLLEQSLNHVALYWKALPMRPGRYRLQIVVKDLNGDKLGTLIQGVQVPGYGEDKVSSSSLILADVLEPVSIAEVGSGDFVLGPSRVRPKVQIAGKPVSFRHDQNIGLWMQVYHLALDENTRKPAGTVEYQVVNTSTNQQVIDIRERAEQVGTIADQVTLEKSLPAGRLAPGEYQLTVKVTDLILGQTVTSAARFAVE